MKTILTLPSIKSEDVEKIISFFKYYDKHSFITKEHLVDRTEISMEVVDEVINLLLERGIFKKAYIFWCKCDEEQLNVIYEEEYNKLDYEMCGYCCEEYIGERAKKQYKLKYQFQVDGSELCLEKKETNSSQT